MIQSETPKIVKKKLFSPIWLLPAVALILGLWLLVKGIKDAGVEITIHFPNATGIEIGKTLVKYQGVNVGKVTDIEIDNSLQGVVVTVNMNYRGEPFLNENTQFWLVSPKASITKIEGLDTLFSGNYIAIKPGDGARKLKFEASLEAPPIMPASEGMLLTLYAEKLGSIDIGSHIFYRQIPVGNVVSFRLDQSDLVAISVFIQKQYAYLVKENSRFWNASGVKFHASLSGVKVQAESLASIIAGGINFDSPKGDKPARSGETYTLFDSEAEANGGTNITLAADTLDFVSVGASIQYRGLKIGKVTDTALKGRQVEIKAEIFRKYAKLLTVGSKFWTEGAHLGLDGIRHASRLITGSVINFLPGQGKVNTSFKLLNDAPETAAKPGYKFTISGAENYGFKSGSQIKYLNIKIGEIKDVQLTKDLSQVIMNAEISPEFRSLINDDNYFVPVPALDINAGLTGVSVKTGDLAGALSGAIALVGNKSSRAPSTTMSLFKSKDIAAQKLIAENSVKYQLASTSGYGLETGAAVFYKNMRIGQVASVSWLARADRFKIDLLINNKYQKLLNNRSVFWRNQAASVDASLSGIKVDIAPLEGLLKSSINLGLLDKPLSEPNTLLFDSKRLALIQAKPISITFSAKSGLKANSAIKYQGYEVGKVTRVKLNQDLDTLTATAYLENRYAEYFTRSDSRYSIVDAQVSLAGIKAPETLLTGPYVNVLPGVSRKHTSVFKGTLEQKPFSDVAKDSINLVLTKSELGSVTTATRIFYRGIPIGKVEAFQLTPAGDKVEIQACIENKFARYVNTSSRFWERSGIKVDAGLFSGIKVDTGSLENVLIGGIAVVTRDKTNAGNRLRNDASFTLHQSANDKWNNWAPKQ